MGTKIPNGNYLRISEAIIEVPEPEGMEGIAKLVIEAVRQYAPSSAEPEPKFDPSSDPRALDFYNLKPSQWSRLFSEVFLRRK